MRDSQPLKHPEIAVDKGLLRQLFVEGGPFGELRNPHIEPRVGETVRARAKPSAVLIAVVDDPAGPRVLVTRRTQHIRFAGHICFPGGKVDDIDASIVDTALREAEEEICLAPSRVEVLGSLGDYYTQAGYCITPVVGIVDGPLEIAANPDEVDEIMSISMARMFQAENYRVTWRSETRGHISFHEGDIRIAGPTVSLMIGLYESLLQFRGLLD